MTRLAALGLALIALLAVVACGSDDTEGDDPASEATPTATATATTVADAGAGSEDREPLEKFARVTIGDESWEFDLSGTAAACIALDGSIGGAGRAADGAEVTVDISLPPGDWESRPASEEWSPPELRVTDDVNDRDWRAGGEVVLSVLAESGNEFAEVSQVDTFIVDGSSATGTATFIEMSGALLATEGEDLPDPVTGTFEVFCGT